MFMLVVAPLNIAKSQGFTVILNWSTILHMMYGKNYIPPLPLNPNQEEENGTFWLLHGFILDLGEGWGDSEIVVSFAVGGTSS